MSKRKGSTTTRQSKRHKSNNYDDGKTDLQREMELYQQQQQQQEQEEIYRAQQAIQRQQQQSNNNTQQISYNNIQVGTPISDDDDDIDDQEEYQGNNNIRDDSESDYNEEDQPVSHTQPEPTDYSPNKKRNIIKSETTTPSKPDPITLSDLRAVQMKRSALERICTEPFFADFIGRSRVPIPNEPEYERELPGLFCRIYIGDRQTSSGGSEPIYRICEMINVEDWKRPYVLTDKKTITSVGLLIAHGRTERVFKIVQTSNSPFTEKEFKKWKDTLFKDNVPLPTKDELSEAYLNAVKRHKNFKYDAVSIAKMREKKNKNFNAKLLANPHKEKLRITTIISGLNDDDLERLRYEKYLNEINKEIERRNSQQSQSIKVSIASINEKNKIKNKKLMLKAREKERKLKRLIKGKKQMKDPFTRAITAPTIESFNDTKIDEISGSKLDENKIDEMKREKKVDDYCFEELNNLSILSDKKRIVKKYKPIISGTGDGLSLIKDDLLWSSVVHNIAKDFVEKCQGIELDDGGDGSDAYGMRQPQFGRNTNPSKYGNVFTKRPRDLQIISIDEYLRNKYKYSTM